METIVREKVNYGVVLFDKYILCDVKTVLIDSIQFKPLDKINYKQTKVRIYKSEKVLRNEAPHHFQVWNYHLRDTKDRCRKWDREIEPWWDEITNLDTLLKEAGYKGISGLSSYPDNGAWDYCIKQKYIKVIKIKERLVFEE